MLSNASSKSTDVASQHRFGKHDTIGERSTEWRDVAIDRVDFENMGGRRPHNYLVHQIDVRTKDFAYTLDGVLMEQGAAIVAETYRHKLPTTT